MIEIYVRIYSFSTDNIILIPSILTLGILRALERLYLYVYWFSTHSRGLWNLMWSMKTIKKNPNLRTARKHRPCTSHWPCVKTSHYLVLGQDVQESILCTPAVFVVIMSSLYVQCCKWFINGAHPNSISCHNVTYWHNPGQPKTKSVEWYYYR